jgi:hypothetical protein
VPRLGGAAESAVDGENCLVVDTCDEDATYEAVASLVGDRARLRLLQAGAAATGSRYSVVRAALSEYVLFDREYRQRFTSATSEQESASRG